MRRRGAVRILGALAALAAIGPPAGPVGAWATTPAVEAGVRRAFERCRAVEDERERVRCYDRLADLLSPPRFEGRLTAQTESFEITKPTVLRYESDGPIFVMYLKDARGGIVQNLHIGGGGSATYLIDKPGTYSLQVSGSETWRIWLDPVG